MQVQAENRELKEQLAVHRSEFAVLLKELILILKEKS